MSGEYTVKLSKKTVDLLQAVIKEGRFGDTIEDVLNQIINNRIHHVEDFRLATAIGLLRLHYTDAESLSMIRGTINQRERSLKEAKIVYQDGMKRLQNQTGIILKEQTKENE